MSGILIRQTREPGQPPKAVVLNFCLEHVITVVGTYKVITLALENEQ